MIFHSMTGIASGSASRKRIMVVGGTGVFGVRLCEGLAGQGRFDIVIAGRSEHKALDLIARLLRMDPDCAARFETFDRTQPSPARLSQIAPNIIVDAAGPFQESGYALPEAAIAQQIHYVDLADGREFVAGIAALDRKAKKAGVAVISGASSVPALSHAVLDDLTRRWTRVDKIAVAISPGQRSPRGLSVMRAILSYVGKPVRVFINGAWTEAPGWGLQRVMKFPGTGRRYVSLCETPDLDLLVERYHPRAEALFLAGLELAFLHKWLGRLGGLVRRGWIESLVPYAKPMRFIAGLVERFGTDQGGMVVEATGENRDGPVRARWALAAAGGHGPTVPSLPALAVVLALDEGRLSYAGASACAGFLRLRDITHLMDRKWISITRDEESISVAPLFAIALGDPLSGLPDVTRRIHLVETINVYNGHAEINGPRNPLARLVCRLFGFPVKSTTGPLRVVMERVGDEERWSRMFAGHQMSSVLSRPDPDTSSIVERFGPSRVRMALRVCDAGLDMIPIEVRFGFLKLPRFLWPRISAREDVGRFGRHRFNVTVGLPVAGHLFGYCGELAVSSKPPDRMAGKEAAEDA